MKRLERDYVPAASGCGNRRFGRFTVLLSGLAIGVALLAGCNRGLAVRDSNAFQSAPAELKTMWATAYAAAKTNGYSVAYPTLLSLRAQTNLDAQQIQAVDELIGVVGARMFDAANKGDAEAVKALQQVQSTTRRR